MESSQSLFLTEVPLLLSGLQLYAPISNTLPASLFTTPPPDLQAERKRRKAGAAQSHARVAERLLAAQLRREALNHTQAQG